MKLHIANWIDSIIGCLLSLLGFTAVSCDTNTIGWGRCEYGTPHADYKVIGSVTDEAKNPLKNIQVVTEKVFPGDAPVQRDTVYTDDKGDFAVIDNNTFPRDHSVNVIFNDIDGESNGGYFESQTIEKVTYKKTKKGDSHWYDGSFTATVNSTLKKKTSNEH